MGTSDTKKIMEYTYRSEREKSLGNVFQGKGSPFPTQSEIQERRKDSAGGGGGEKLGPLIFGDQ